MGQFDASYLLGFSKKVENLARAVSLHYMHYNFAHPHQTLRKANHGYPTTRALAGYRQRVSSEPLLNPTRDMPCWLIIQLAGARRFDPPHGELGLQTHCPRRRS